MSHPSPPLGQSLSPPSNGQKTSVPSSPEDWKEMKDPRTGRSYWVNHVTKQMSYNPPVLKTSPPSGGAKSGLGKQSAGRRRRGTCGTCLAACVRARRGGALSAGSACAGLSRLDELLERYEKITEQNRAMQNEKDELDKLAQDRRASPALIKTQTPRAQRGAAPPPSADYCSSRRPRLQTRHRFRTGGHFYSPRENDMTV